MALNVKGHPHRANGVLIVGLITMAASGLLVMAMIIVFCSGLGR
jgi:hypothetical protein